MQILSVCDLQGRIDYAERAFAARVSDGDIAEMSNVSACDAAQTLMQEKNGRLSAPA